jgi:ribose transport system ATP-binding protein
MLGADQTLLTMSAVSKAFPGVQALSSADFDLRSGEVHALVGENGAGKSTLMKILSGVYTPDSGQIFINGQAVYMRNVYEARQLGIAIIFQELSQVLQLTVAQNIFLGREPRRAFGIVDEQSIMRETRALLEDYQIHLDPATPVGKLRTAERQLAEIAKAVSVGARIMIMDEPTSSLTIDETENLFRIVSRLKSSGVGIIYISHRMDEISKLADRITVLRDGKCVGTYGAAEVSITEVVRLMVGRELALVDGQEPPSFDVQEPDRAPILAVKNLTRKRILHDITFSVRPGEILGLVGLIGSGRSEIARALIGVDPIDSGEIYLNGAVVHLPNPRLALAAGVALVPEDRRLQGLVMRHTIEQNVVLSMLTEYSRAGIVNSRACRRATLAAIDQLHIQPRDPDRMVHILSGGNQQKVILAKWLIGKPKILILDEPTVGVDVGAKAEIHQLIWTLAAGGMGILLISSDLPEIIMLSHRLLVVNDGRICGEFSRSEVTQDKIMAQIMQNILAKGEVTRDGFNH